MDCKAILADELTMSVILAGLLRLSSRPWLVQALYFSFCVDLNEIFLGCDRRVVGEHHMTIRGCIM